jgi:iron complex transport system substrate-binding protein
MVRYLVFFVVLFLYSCSENESDSKSSSDFEEITEKSDTLTNQYAEAFRIIEHTSYTEIQILNTESKEVEFRYSVGQSSDEKIVGINQAINRVVALSSTHIGMMEKLELTDRIVGISDEKYLCSSQLKSRINNDFVKSVGDIGMSDIEGYIAVNPDLVIYSGFDTKAPILQKLKSAGIRTFTNYDWKETHPLGRAEWLKVFGVLFEKQDEAEMLYNKIKMEYLNLVEKVEDFSSEEKVLVGTLYGDIFNAPAGDSYMAKILEDANLDYKYQETKGTGSISLTLEEVISDNRKTSIWLNVAAQSKSKVLEMNSRFSLLESIENNRVYSYYHEVNCFWENSAISPHLLLQDICKIAYPEKFKDKTFYFYKELD